MMSLIKKSFAGFLLLSSISILLAYGYFRNEIDQMLGGNTMVVNTDGISFDSGEIAITNVHVLSEDSNYMRENLTVFLKDRKIIKISNSEQVPVEYKVINGQGRFLIPGLIDSHVHLKKSKNDLLLYIANGVTQIGEMTGMSHHFDYIAEYNQGAISPGIYIASPKVTSKSDWFTTVRSMFEQREQNFTTSEAVRKAVLDYKEDGYQSIKLSSDMSSESYFAINDEATKQGIPIIGHLPVGLTLDDLYKSGQSQLSHIDSIVQNLANQYGGIYSKNREDFLIDFRSKANEIAKKFKQHDIALSSTVWLHKTIEQQMFELPEFFKSIELEYQNPGWLEGSKVSKGCLPGSNNYQNRHSKSPATKQAYMDNRLAYNEAIKIITLALMNADVTILAGTDALGACGMIAGFSLHNELKELNRLGLSNSQVLQATTSVPAKWMGLKTGVIKEGYRADLLLLDKNPLIDINNTRTINAVIANGNYIEKSQLDKMLNEVKKANEQSRKVKIEELLK